MDFLNLIRYKNLIIIAVMQVIVKYGLFSPLGVQVALDTFQFVMLVIATLCIAAAGNVINDIYDIEIDRINKPEKQIVSKGISELAANRIFIALNITGVGLGFYVANSVGSPGFAAIFIISSALLYMYASYIKGILLVGNILVSVLVSLSLLIVGVFDIIPAIDTDQMDLQVKLLRVLFHYATFAFLINLIREIVKDLQDINGDKNGGIHSLPIAIGRIRTTFVVFLLGALLVFTVIAYMYVFLYKTQVIVLYFLFLIVAPLLYFCIKSWSAKTKKEYAFLSLILKLIMLSGMCSMLLYKYVVLGF